MRTGPPQPSNDAETGVLNNEILLELFKHHVLDDDEVVRTVHTWPDSVGVAVQTDGRLLTIRDDPEFLLIGRAPWVDGLAVLEREDVFASGERETDAIVVTTDARRYHLNDEAVAVELAQRVSVDLDPMAYAQVLVAYHPWSTARRELLLDTGQLRAQFGITDGPPVEPLRQDETAVGVALTFFSATVHNPLLGARWRCDVYQWRVDIPRDGRVTWGRRLAAENLDVPKPPVSVEVRR
ncbi:hypothetical protein [Amycolatopsis taiwanensis]|uniref:Uncharacterized protein n=1 Tax=Amycolatopsis taiwanensis TaxID=342230 RepID=A0A9W6QY28_9PSEU|nr:hypothetical protein [Amycolatopsis taiwanensis]GLY65838.1 hypothetical protein Atai01_24570 [Amycolatopsis taiwanensis]